MSKKRSLLEKFTNLIRMNDDNSESIEIENSDSDELLNRNNDWPEENENEGELSVDVHQTPTEIVIKAMVAGVKPEDLDVSITRDMVTIKGKRDDSREVSNEDYFFKELYWGSFSRTILLPQEVEADEAEATEKNGLLVLRLPKLNKEKQTKLRVRS